jgi:hypothetical protein
MVLEGGRLLVLLDFFTEMGDSSYASVDRVNVGF